jgi:hypothetical protein
MKGMMKGKGGGMMKGKGGGMMKGKGGGTPSITIAEFIESEPDLSKFYIALRRANNITLSPEELDIIFDGDVPGIEIYSGPGYSGPGYNGPGYNGPGYTGPGYEGGAVRRKLQNSALRRNNLLDVLDQPGDFTYFAPTNGAFSLIPRDCLEKLFLEEQFRPNLEDLVLYQGFVGERFTPAFEDGERINTFLDENILVATNPVRINTFNLARPNNDARNGVTHIIRGVLRPSSFNAFCP